MRVLIIKTSPLSDLVNALPVLDYLKQAASGIEIDWVVEEPLAPVLEGNPLLDSLHTVHSEAWRQRPFAASTRREVALLKETFRERAYDLVFDLQGDLKSGVISKLSGCPDRIGFEKTDLNDSVNALFSTRRIPMRRQDYHLSERYLRMVSVPFAKNYREMQLTASVQTSPEDEANAEALLATLSDGLVFLFQYGSTLQTNLWSEQSWIALGRAVLERFKECTILFAWDNEAEREVVTRLAAMIGNGARVIERYSLKGLAALLKKVDLVVGGDSGPVHLAAALGTPTVSFYRASDGKGCGPRGERHVVIQSPMHCSRCLRTRCDKDLQCRDTVKVEAVLSGVESLLAG